jgi:acetyl-CoA carboxylase biotin carboxyl carrier protein
MTLTATARDEATGIAIASPSIGWWHPRVAIGAIVRGGDVLGELDVLGTRHDVIAPPEAHGAVVDGARGAALTAVGFGATLVVLDPRGAAEVGATATAAAKASAEQGGLAFHAPISGRFFARPGPGKPPFVEVGAVLEPGTTVCMLEVMKTFNRVTYGGQGLPDRARVAAILVADEEDVTMGQAILRLEAL